MSPTQRSIKLLKEQGWQVQRVEHWNAFAKRRIDLWCGDLIAAHPTHGIALVQTTTGANLSARRIKCQESKYVLGFITAGGHFFLHGWRKIGGRGQRKFWDVRVEEIGPNGCGG